jgi:branched-chain amino acid transport system permease protein
MAIQSAYFEPTPAFDPVVSFTVVTIAIIGGSDEVRGPFFGALFLVTLSELLWAHAPNIYLILLGLLLISFVLFIPEGIVGRLLINEKRRLDGVTGG